MNVCEFLREHHKEFEVVEHPRAYSAQRMAEVMHVCGEIVAKTVLLKVDKGYRFYLAVVPATQRVDLDKVRSAMGVADVDLATENEIRDRFRDCEIGAMPPFGSQLGMETIVDECLSFGDRMVFEGNTHEQAISMRFRDYYELEHPLIVQIAASEAQ